MMRLDACWVLHVSTKDLPRNILEDCTSCLVGTGLNDVGESVGFRTAAAWTEAIRWREAGPAIVAALGN